MTKLFAVAIPILPGKTDQFRAFTNELKGKRNEEFVASRKKLKVREQTFLQSTPTGDLVIVTLEGENPQSAFEQFGKQTDPFSKWFGQQVKEIHGMDLSQPMKGSMPELIVDSQNLVKAESAL